jgi:hypothetical protein
VDVLVATEFPKTVQVSKSSTGSRFKRKKEKVKIAAKPLQINEGEKDQPYHEQAGPGAHTNILHLAPFYTPYV